MRKLISICLLLALALPLGAQTIQKGDKFFNGETLYTVKEIRMGTIVYMTGENAAGDYLELTLEKVPGKAGEYTLRPSSQADDSPFPGAGFGSEIQYVRKQGMSFLAVKSDIEGVAEIMILTPDNLKNSIGQQEFAENQPLSELVGTLLLNRPLVEPWSTPELVDLVNGVLNKDNPDIIETYNRKLLEGTISLRNARAMFDNPDGLGGDGRDPYEIGLEEKVKDRITFIFKEVARRNAGGDGAPTPEDIEIFYTTTLWRGTVARVMAKDENSEDMWFFDHDYWTFSQDPSPALKIKKISVEELDDVHATAFIVFTNRPGDKPQTMWVELELEEGELRINNFRDYDDVFDDGYFDYLEEMTEYLGEKQTL
ncbi:MAG: hypothetical protein IJ840_00265 [Bacteroidales bacterium]|nr:hypothetical protein [Bacteroidales bacterium]